MKPPLWSEVYEALLPFAALGRAYNAGRLDSEEVYSTIEGRVPGYKITVGDLRRADRLAKAIKAAFKS